MKSRALSLARGLPTADPKPPSWQLAPHTSGLPPISKMCSPISYCPTFGEALPSSRHALLLLCLLDPILGPNTTLKKVLLYFYSFPVPYFSRSSYPDLLEGFNLTFDNAYATFPSSYLMYKMAFREDTWEER